MSNEKEREALARNMATMIALVGLLAVGGGLFLLVLMVLSPNLFFLACGALFFASIGVFHYVTWGWWLGGAIEREDARREAKLRENR